MNRQEADRCAEHLARLTVFNPGSSGRGNEEALLEWLADQDADGWPVAYASACIRHPGSVSACVWGMMMPTAQWDTLAARKTVCEWGGCDEGWCYQGGVLRKYGMEWGCEEYDGGYPVTLRRSAPRGTKINPLYIEIDQRMTLPEGLHWYEEYQCWCRWSSEEGRVEPMIVEGTYESADGGAEATVVLVSETVLKGQQDGADHELIQMFDWTGAGENHAGHYTTDDDEYHHADGIAYRRRGEPDGYMYIRGARRVQVQEDTEGDSTEEEGVKFLCWPWAPGDPKHAECRESGVRRADLRSYFEPPDDRCLEITPVFFDAEVLTRYKQNKDRYEVQDRQIHAYDAWTLKTYDINDAGQVHTYLVYLGQLPRKEQLYWLAHNEAPKARISDRAFTTDIEGNFGPDTSINRLRRMAERQTQKGSVWWRTHDPLMVERYLPTHDENAVEPWKQAVIELHQCTIENMLQEFFDRDVDKGDRDKERGLPNKLRRWLSGTGITEEDATEIVAPLTELNQLRNTVAHGKTPEKAQKAVAKAMAFQNRLRGHSIDLTDRVVESLLRVEDTVEKVKAGSQRAES